MTDGFFRAVYEVVAQIPYGRVMTYGDIARMIGYPGRARYVGYAMRVCPGSIAGGDFAPVRKALLAQENVPFLPDGRVDLERCRLQHRT